MVKIKKILFLGLALIAAGILLFQLSGEKAENPQKNESVIYKVAEYENGIGVFIDGENEPREVYSVDFSALPPADRELLKNGVTADSREKLQRIIEDYTS